MSSKLFLPLAILAFLANAGAANVSNATPTSSRSIETRCAVSTQEMEYGRMPSHEYPWLSAIGRLSSSVGQPSHVAIGAGLPLFGHAQGEKSDPYMIAALEMEGSPLASGTPANCYPPLSLVTSSIPSATVGSSYSVSLAANGGQPPYTWSFGQSSLPQGFSISSNGNLSGTPSTAGTYTFHVVVADSLKNNLTEGLTLTVAAPAPTPTPTPTPVPTPVSNPTGSTSTAIIPYPGTIPCPGSSCTGGGAALGINTTITPSDFGLPITRVTDFAVMDATGNANYNPTASYNWSWSGGSYALPMDITDTRFIVYTPWNFAVPFEWNPSTLTATPLYGQDYVVPHISSTMTFSYTQPYVAYALAFPSTDPILESYNFSSTTVAPTPTPLVDLSTCVPALAGLGGTWNSDVIVSNDDQTFGIALSSTSGQGSSGAVYIVVWNRTNGCRVYNTGTGVISGAWGATGTVSMADRFTLHNVILSPGGDWMQIVYATCNTTCQSPLWEEYFWQISTLNTITALTDDSLCGHIENGFSNAVNNCDYSTTYNHNTWYKRPYTNVNEAPPATHRRSRQALLRSDRQG